ncbi:flagellar hook-basal body complex protein FliE [Ruficoccus amylovorans]|uniref:Flagellar hook-basal body complex protein FliE n=1 Tax=Ruficoccus amylovorans TaxID=1804625 RepID=A0A842HEJ2_9BACT|nr:flagellar hook-basal body complex protein FliE [Ruficoccus amylovorans]MBC2595005.1 flagellar hook-basal body complex protein FliE [Ruficoccus amylovorans]
MALSPVSFNSQITQSYDPGKLLARLRQQNSGTAAEAGQPFAESLQRTTAAAESARAEPTGESGILTRIGDFVREVDHKDKVSAELRQQVIAGDATSLHQAVIAAQEANVSFSLMVEMRNKVLETYQELMRLQV